MDVFLILGLVKLINPAMLLEYAIWETVSEVDSLMFLMYHLGRKIPSNQTV